MTEADQEARLHLICGPVGVGKTTYAMELTRRLGGLRFSIDDWMEHLFFPDWPEQLTYEWAFDRARRCEDRILATAFDVLGLGKDVIFDGGLMERAQRDRILEAVRPWPWALRLHALEAPRQVRLERVRFRNREKPPGFVMEVSDEIFDFMEARSSPVADDEAEDIVRINTALE